MTGGLSLANKCLLLFGFAVVVILGAALAVPWVRTKSTVRDNELEVARQLADAWLAGDIELRMEPIVTELPVAAPASEDPLRIAVVPGGLLLAAAERGASQPEPTPPPPAAGAPAEDPPAAPEAGVRFPVRAWEALREDPARREYWDAEQVEGRDLYYYARRLSGAELARLGVEVPSSPGAAEGPPAVLLVVRWSEFAAGQLLLGRVYIVASWLFASLLAVLVFYLILTKLIFSPVRKLRETAEKIQAGDTTIRATIRTGDEFEQLSDAFNSMLERVATGQEQLRSLNESLDLKVNELAEANIGLYESNRLKGEFLANVSHELRTPLNSIIGFAELLDEVAREDPEADPKRRRYLSNILNSARTLLEMINDLLEMARIEAGRMQVVVESMSVSDLVEGLQAVMRPQAEARGVTIETRVPPGLPVVETDPGKVQQILYNFLSNAIKFSPEGGTVTIVAERLARHGDGKAVRLGVVDRGPGIPYDMQDTIFEKFRQVDASHTRLHGGVGLGLAICRELGEMLGASLSLVSDPGKGATFYVDLPAVYQPKEPQALLA